MKVWGIGLGRTGTKSLAAAMWHLGYNVKHGVKYIDSVWKYDFCCDIFIAVRYKFLDYCFPGSKFILTTRDIDRWIKSSSMWDKKRAGQVHPIKGINIPLRRAESRFMLYGTTIFEERTFRDAFERHYRGVIHHFKYRPQDLLIIDICGGEGWEKLCPFLGKELPEMSFPHKNRQEYKK